MVLHSRNEVEPKSLFEDFVGIIEHSLLEQSSNSLFVCFIIK